MNSGLHGRMEMCRGIWMIEDAIQLIHLLFMLCILALISTLA